MEEEREGNYMNRRDNYLAKVSVRNEMEKLAKQLVKDIHNYDYDEMACDIACLEEFLHCLKEITFLGVK